MIAQDFYLGVYPVTQQQFGVWTRSTDYKAWFASHREAIRTSSYEDTVKPHSNYFNKRPQHPADSVTWWEARGYAEWLTRAGLLPAGWVAELPSEAEWEYACRAGAHTQYWSGDGVAALAEVGWYDDNSGGTTHAVGDNGSANAFGLHDMHGNVWEWCLDAWKDDNYRTHVDSSEEPPQGPSRVLRGGSWDDPASVCRSAYRLGNWPGSRGRGIGFRLAWVPGSSGSGSGRAGGPVGAAEPAGAAVARRDAAAPAAPAGVAARPG